MTRLQAEIERLFGPPHAAADDAVRTLVLELARPAEWRPLAPLWQGVQADLGWPAPAIAVNGVDAYQLWFSFEQALPLDQALRLLDLLRQRYLADLAPDRLSLLPGPSTALPPTPPRQVAADAWSAFVTSDLAAVFADTPWLDLPPGDDAQAELLGRLLSTPAADVARLLATPLPVPDAAPTPAPSAQPLSPPRVEGLGEQEARQFLLSVVHDTSIALPLRIDAAKALLR